MERKCKIVHHDPSRALSRLLICAIVHMSNRLASTRERNPVNELEVGRVHGFVHETL